ESDESVEEFREHLKHFVRTFLEGTVTVRGILRVVAEALGLRIEDEYADMESWWRGGRSSSIRVVRRLEDAAPMLLGVDRHDERGRGARPAEVTSEPHASDPIDLGPGAVLHLRVDDGPPESVPLPSSGSLEELAAAIAGAVGRPIARVEGRRLRLSS